jgi:hypothetical protein
MVSDHTADEVEQQYLEKMGAELGAIFHALWNEVVRLHANWQEYRTLYGTSEAEIAVLNETAPFFFRVVQDSLWEGTLLHLCRLTDPSRIGKRENLTLSRLPACIDDPELRARIDALITRAMLTTDFARDSRNRHIAHNDLALAVDAQAEPLKAGSRKRVEDALSAIRETMNEIDRHFRGSEVGYQHFMTGYGRADALIYHLRESIEKERKERRDLGVEDDAATS